MAPENCKYTKEHEWIRVEGDTGIVGITDHAAEKLGDVTFIELPQVGAQVSKGEAMATVESVKAASEIYAPAGGAVAEVNTALEEQPELINDSPFEGGWIVKITLSDAGELGDLMDAAAYQSFVDSLDE
jgi:glycine cleavage system H protein